MKTLGSILSGLKTAASGRRVSDDRHLRGLTRRALMTALATKVPHQPSIPLRLCGLNPRSR